MKIVDVRNLQHHLGSFLDDVERGETLEIRRRRRVIARIVPYTEDGEVGAWPDVAERLNSLYSEGPPSESAAERLYEDRDER